MGSRGRREAQNAGWNARDRLYFPGFCLLHYSLAAADEYRQLDEHRRPSYGSNWKTVPRALA
jgi:hypothetical protein